MGIWWVTAIGFILCLGFIGGTFIHFLSRGLDTDDATRIDRINEDPSAGESNQTKTEA